jgi:cell wall-associated NlpC family hydrolase
MSYQGIDCSGLVHMAYRHLGILIPRDSGDQEAFGEKIAWEEMQAGDLITYARRGAANPLEAPTFHIAFHHSGDKILHAAYAADDSGRVRLETEPEHFIALRRHCVRIPW